MRRRRLNERNLRKRHVATDVTKSRAPVPATDRDTGWGANRRRVWHARTTPLAGALALIVALAGGCGGGAKTIFIPTVYVVAGRVADPTTNPIAGVPGARLVVETASSVAAVTSDANGDFVLQGVPPGTHRVRADLAGRISTLTYDFVVAGNVVDAFVPIFTPVQIDSVLTARGAPAWDRQQGLFGLFALKSTGVPLGDAVASLLPAPGGALVQTGEGADPIVVVNGTPGSYRLAITRGGYLWDGPYGVTLRPQLLTFAAPRARPNFNGFLFAHLPGGPPIEGATAEALRGADAASTGSATTNFIGQFSIVGLPRATYTARFAAAGFLPTLSFPQPLDQDTTLAAIAFTADSLAAWAAAGGAAAPTPGLGTIVLDVRDAVTGAPIEGATVEMASGAGRGTALTARALALRLDVPAGLHRTFARAPGYADAATQDSVRVAAGEVTFGTVELEPGGFARHQRR